MVVSEDMEYTLTVLVWDGGGDGFSVGSGLLRTVSAGAGISFLPSDSVAARCARIRAVRRYHKNSPMARERKSRTPMTAPARAPLLTPEDL